MSKPFTLAGPAAVYSSLPSRVSMGQPPGATATGELHSGGAGGGGGGATGWGGGGSLSSSEQPPSRPTVTIASRPIRKILFMLTSPSECFQQGSCSRYLHAA